MMKLGTHQASSSLFLFVEMFQESTEIDVIVVASNHIIDEKMHSTGDEENGTILCV